MHKHRNEEEFCLAVAFQVIVMLVGTITFPTRSGWGMTPPEKLRTRHEGIAKKNGTPIRLPTTYADRKNNTPIFDLWKKYVGRWVSHDDSGKEVIVVAFVPRLPRPGKDAPHGILMGFIPKGKYEGVLLFQRSTGHTDGNATGVIEGKLLKADRNLTRLKAQLMTPGLHPHDQAPDTRWLMLRIHEDNRQKEFLLQWASDIDESVLSDISIIAHRGLGFGGLDNRREALRHTWYFGASGIEFDITVPFRYTNTSNGRAHRLPLASGLLVYHPPLINQTRDVDRIPAGFLSVKQVFDDLDNYGVPFIYVDPKVRWLPEDIRRGVLEDIITFAHEALDRNDNLTITIAAPDENTAEFLSDAKQLQLCPYFIANRLSWTLEWTEVTEARNFLRRGTNAPFALSFNLVGIRRGFKWPLIKWVFRNIPENEEKEIANKKQPLIFWTANSDDHFTGSVEAARQPNRMGGLGESREIAIMTDYPHRLAYWLATSRGDMR